MTALSYDSREDGWDRYDENDPDHDRMPGRPRRRYLNPASAGLAALVVGAIGFYVGVRLEKGRTTATSTSGAGGALASAFAARARAAGSASRGAGVGATGAAGGGAGGAGTAGAAGAGAAGAGARGFGALGALAGGGPSFGTVSSVSGRTLYLSDSSGNTVKVRLPSSAKVSKSESVSRKAIRPGDTVVIQGVKNSSGTLVAASVSDSGNSGRSTTASGSGSSGSSGGSGGAGSGVGSLFSSGGAG